MIPKIEVVNGSFSYNNRDMIWENVNLQVNEGTVSACWVPTAAARPPCCIACAARIPLPVDRFW